MAAFEFVMAHVYLRGLDADMTEARIKAALAKHGKVLSVRLDPTDQSARVAFLDARAAEAFTCDVRRDPAFLGGRSVTVETTVPGAPTRTEAAVAVAPQSLSASAATVSSTSSSSSSSEHTPGQQAFAQLRRPGIHLALLKQLLEVST